MKFKAFIRLVLKHHKKDNKFLEKTYPIFKYVDKLHEARMARMINLKKIMARQVVEQNSLKFEIIEKMNNLANLAQYKHKYGKICKEIDEYYEKIEAEGSKPELQQLSRRGEDIEFI